jgi:expansin (peptidoglycan-binding protein)
MFDGFPGAGDNPNNNPICGKKAQITCNGKTITVTITDRCQACKYGDLDLSPAAFDALADPSVGRTDMTWEMLA